MKIGPLGKEKEIRQPKGFKIEPMELSVSDRTASGRKVKDIIAVKDIFTLTYNGLFPDDMKTFTDIYKKGEAVSFIYKNENGIQNTMVHITSLPRELYTPRMELSKNITITLEEV